MKNEHRNPGGAPLNSGLSTHNEIAIAVKCANPSVVKYVISAERKAGSLKFSSLKKYETKSSAESVIPSSAKDDPVNNVNELLLQQTYQFLIRARNILKPTRAKYIWSRNEQIYIKRNDHSIINTVNNLKDIVKLKTHIDEHHSSLVPIHMQ